MPTLTKSDQWKRAHVVAKWAGEPATPEGEFAYRERLRAALEIIHSTAPWEYPWSEVVRSIRDKAR